MQKTLVMLKPIRSKQQLQTYLERAYVLMQMDLQPRSKESDELEVLSMLIEQYEKEKYPIESPNPIDAILFRLEQQGLKRSDLQRILGSRSRSSELLSGKRKLSLGMIRKLHESLGISAETLIKNYDVVNG